MAGLAACASDPTRQGYFTASGAFSYASRVEAATGYSSSPGGAPPRVSFRADPNQIIAAGFDGPFGEIVDFSDPDHPASGSGAEFSTCDGARTATTFFFANANYNQDVLYITCPNSRQATITPVAGGFSQLEFYNYVPGAAMLDPGTSRLVVADFENGQLRLQDRSAAAPPAADIIIPLSNPLERSCPFSLVVQASVAYVVGREGVTGTSTENCNSWRGLWFVNLATNQVVDFLPFGTLPRDVELGSDNRVYVSDFAEDKVYVFDAVSRTPVRTINVGDGPVGMALTADASTLFVTNWNTNQVQAIDLSTDKEIDSHDSGGVQPVDVFLSGNTLGVLNFGDAANNIAALIQFFTLQ